MFIEPPSILPAAILNISIEEGEPLELTCECHFCEPINKATWYWKNQTLPGMETITKSISSKIFNYILQIPISQQNNSGQYICVLENDNGIDQISYEIDVYGELYSIEKAKI